MRRSGLQAQFAVSHFAIFDDSRTRESIKREARRRRAALAARQPACQDHASETDGELACIDDASSRLRSPRPALD
jgi:hypothetical protein